MLRVTGTFMRMDPPPNPPALTTIFREYCRQAGRFDCEVTCKEACLRQELMDLFVAGRDQSAADQPNNLAEGHPPL